jgi:N-acetylglucosaminyldiphosphoundecaprenol N-acetyl-beta-D-mannosaminyltransferase
VSPLTCSEVVEIATNGSGKRLLLHHNLHSSYLHETDANFRRLYQRADRTIVDGAPILWLTSLFTGSRLSAVYRIPSTEWIAALSQVDTPRRLFAFGATAESNRKAVEELRRHLTTWTVAGVDGYVDDDVAIRRIADFAPDLVIVGLGMPRQEHFLLRNLDRLPDATYATVGGAIDYLAGTRRLAPRWLGPLGVEWLWRLAGEPRRLGYRYLVEPTLLLYRVALRCVKAPRPRRRSPRPVARRTPSPQRTPSRPAAARGERQEVLQR